MDLNCLDGVFLTTCSYPIQNGAPLDSVLRNELAQMIEISMSVHFGNSGHNFMSFKIVMDKDKTGLWMKALYWGKAD